MDAGKAHSLRVMRLMSGATYKELAKAYNISIRQVGRILAGQSWPEDTSNLCFELSQEMAHTSNQERPV